jgi:hypothetical protein
VVIGPGTELVEASVTPDGASPQATIRLNITANQDLLMPITLSWVAFSVKPCQHMTIKLE